MISLGIKIADNSLKKLQREFQQVDKKIVKAQVRACNRTAVGTRTQVSKSVREKIRVKASDVKDSTKIIKATQWKPEARVDVTGWPLPLVKFASPRKTKKGVTVGIEKGGKRTFRKSAFLATMKSGHEGVFRRLEKPRLPIKEQHGPSIPEIISGNTWKKIENYTNDRLQRELDHEIKRALETT